MNKETRLMMRALADIMNRIHDVPNIESQKIYEEIQEALNPIKGDKEYEKSLEETSQ